MAVNHNMESVNIFQNISCVPQRMTWWWLNEDTIFVLGWTVPLRIAKRERSWTRIWAGLCSSKVLCKHMHATTLSWKAWNSLKKKSSVYENDSPLSTCSSFPKQPPWKQCSLFELEINSSRRATHSQTHQTWLMLSYSLLPYLQPYFLASITWMWVCVNVQRNTSSSITTKPTNLQPWALSPLDALQTSFWRKETGASVDSGRFWWRENSLNHSASATIQGHISSQNGNKKILNSHYHQWHLIVLH